MVFEEGPGGFEEEIRRSQAAESVGIQTVRAFAITLVAERALVLNESLDRQFLVGLVASCARPHPGKLPEYEEELVEFLRAFRYLFQMEQVRPRRRLSRFLSAWPFISEAILIRAPSEFLLSSEFTWSPDLLGELLAY